MDGKEDVWGFIEDERDAWKAEEETKTTQEAMKTLPILQQYHETFKTDSKEQIEESIKDGVKKINKAFEDGRKMLCEEVDQLLAKIDNHCKGAATSIMTAIDGSAKKAIREIENAKNTILESLDQSEFGQCDRSSNSSEKRSGSQEKLSESIQTVDLPQPEGSCSSTQFQRPIMRNMSNSMLVEDNVRTIPSTITTRSTAALESAAINLADASDSTDISSADSDSLLGFIVPSDSEDEDFEVKSRPLKRKRGGDEDDFEPCKKHSYSLRSKTEDTKKSHIVILKLPKEGPSTRSQVDNGFNDAAVTTNSNGDDDDGDDEENTGDFDDNYDLDYDEKSGSRVKNPWRSQN